MHISNDTLSLHLDNFQYERIIWIDFFSDFMDSINVNMERSMEI